MFPRRSRLARAHFPISLKTGRKYTSEHFRIRIPTTDTSGYAVVIPKKTIRSAVRRHQLKRKIIAALQTIELPPAVIIFPTASAGSVHYKDIQKELHQLFSNIRL